MSETYDLFNAYYFVSHQKPTIVLKARNRFGQRKVFYINDFKPYFYAPAEEVKSGTQEVAIDGRLVSRIDVRLPGDVKTQRSRYSKAYEPDIPFPQRYLIDKGIYCGFKQEDGEFVGAESLGVKPRMLSLDIEVEAFGGVPDSKEAKVPIYVIGCYDTYKEDLIQFVAEGLDDESQVKMLKDFFKYVKERDFDLVIGWNPFFDVDFLISKAENLHVRYDNTFGRVNRGERWIDINGREVFDLMAAYKKYFQQTKFDSYSLEFIYKKDFGEPLLKYDYNTTGFDQIDLICRANREHVMAVVKLDEKHHLVGLFDQVRRLCGCNYKQSLTTVYFADLALLRQAHGKFVSPQRPEVEGKKFEFGGGYVMQPEKGVFENVVVLDFKKHYPVAMISYNMSPETVSATPIEDAYEVDGVYFKKEPIGIVPQMLEDFIVRRNEVKSEMKSLDSESDEYQRLYAQQYALKQMVDACFGVQDHEAFRYYQPLIPKSTTFLGRRWIKKAIEIVEESGYHVIYSDTDGAMFEAGEDWRNVGSEIEYKINEYFVKMAEELGLKATPEVDFELAYSRILFKKKSQIKRKRKISKKYKEEAAKKRYAGMVVYEGGKDVNYLKVRGLEIRRSDSALVTRRVQKELIVLILEGKDKAEIMKFIRKEIDEVKSLDVQEFGIPRRLNMKAKDYANIATIRSVLYANKYLKEEIGVGQRCYDVMVKRLRGLPDKMELKMKNGKKKMYKIDRVAVTEKIPESVEMDWNKQIDHVFRMKLEMILDAVGIEWIEVMEKHRSTTLGEF